MAMAARSAPPGALVLLPAEAMNRDGLTIDGLSTDEIARAAGCRRLFATRDIVASVVRFTENASGGARGEEG